MDRWIVLMCVRLSRGDKCVTQGEMIRNNGLIE